MVHRTPSLDHHSTTRGFNTALVASSIITADLSLPGTMYEDAWYSFVPEATGKNAASNNASHGHKRKESLLQQPNVSRLPAAGCTNSHLLSIRLRGRASRYRNR